MIIDPTHLDNLKIEGGVMSGVIREVDPLHIKGANVVVADGVSQFLDYVVRNFPSPKRDEASAYVGKTKSSGWFGSPINFHRFETYDETLRVFQTDPSSIVKFNPAELMPTQYEESGNDVDYNVTGDFIDMGRYLEGVPEAMGAMHNGRTRNRRVRLVVDANQVWSTDESDVIHRSERIIRLIDALESSGVRTEMKVLKVNECSHIEVMVKRFDEPLTLEDVAITTHVDFARRIGFRVNEYSDTFRSNYGTSDWLASKTAQIKSEVNDELTIFIGGSLQDGIDKSFDKLEKMAEEELSQPQPTKSMLILTEGGLESREL